MTEEHSALMAAKRLAAELQLPRQCGTVFAWGFGPDAHILITCDRHWADKNLSVPREYLGFRVEVQDRVDAVAHPF